MGTVNRITLFHTGGMVVSSRLFCTALPNKRKFHPFTVGLIEHSEAGLILFDTGLGSRTHERLQRRPWRLLRRFAPVVYGEHMQLLARLEQLEVQPERIEKVIMSHLHLDHSGGMQDLPWATFHTTQAEWDAGHGQQTIKRMLSGYIFEDYRDATLSFEQFDEDRPVWPFPSSCDLLGDGSVVLLPTPGHTPGHLSAMITLKSGRCVVLAGDAAYVRQNYTIPSDQGVFVKRLRWDHETTWRTILKLRALWRRKPEVDIIPSHDAKLGTRLKKGPLVIV